jgi:hypothetical protein
VLAGAGEDEKWVLRHLISISFVRGDVDCRFQRLWLRLRFRSRIVFNIYCSVCSSVPDYAIVGLTHPNRSLVGIMSMRMSMDESIVDRAYESKGTVDTAACEMPRRQEISPLLRSEVHPAHVHSAQHICSPGINKKWRSGSECGSRGCHCSLNYVPCKYVKT